MTVTTDPLAYYAGIGAALFPIPAGSKNPKGIVKSFAHDHSNDPTQWSAWRESHPGCNFGLVAGPSRLIIADIDTAELGRDAAWSVWCQWWQSRGLAVPLPHVNSARNGWHTHFSVPADVDVSTLRQVPLVDKIEGVSRKSIIDLRVGNGFVVTAGSYYDGTARGESSGPYTLLSDAAPYPAPPALLAACSRAKRSNATVRVGFADPDHVKNVLEWLNDHGAFESYHDWVEIGMILRAEFGDDPGFALWQLTNDGTVSADAEWSKWQSFSTELSENDVKIGTLRKRAKERGCPFSIGVAVAKMFEGVATAHAINPAAAATVARLAADSGAALPLPPITNNLVGNTAKVIADLGQPHLDNFFAATGDVPLNPSSSNFPQLPSACEESYPAIFDQMNSAIARMVAMAETPRSFKHQRVVRVLAVLHHMHAVTYQAVVDRINVLGCALPETKLAQQNKAFEVDLVFQVQGSKRTSFIGDAKGKPDANISDNVAIFLALSNNAVRWDTFAKHAEVAESSADYMFFDQHELDRLWLTAKSNDYNFHPSKDMFRSAIKIEAKRNNSFDALEDAVFALARKWDRLPRLDNWLTRCVNVEDDSYHRTVGRNLIGGMVSRARRPGCVQAETVIFISPEQGTGKSSLCRILSLKDDWFLGSYKFGQSAQSSLPLLAGKWVVELGELAGLNKTDFEDVKTFLSETKDEYVAKYESEPTKNLRRCVFIGTSNIRQPLADPSGNRRFLPVHVVGEIDLEWLRANVEQLIGEAAVRDEKGESFAIPREVWSAAKEVQEGARSVSAVEELCRRWFGHDGNFYILSSDIINAFRMAGLGATTRYGVFMEKLGYRSAQVGPKRDRVWINQTHNDLSECAQLIPAQMQTNGPVEMRPRPVPVAISDLPPLPAAR